MQEIQTNKGVDRELKAYIYQQLMDLQPYLTSDSSLAVVVQQVGPRGRAAYEDDEETYLDSDEILSEESDPDVEEPDAEDSGEVEFVVVLSATLEEGRLDAEGQDSDVYGAFAQAKQRMKEALTEWQNASLNPRDRAIEIQGILTGSHTVH